MHCIPGARSGPFCRGTFTRGGAVLWVSVCPSSVSKNLLAEAEVQALSCLNPSGRKKTKVACFPEEVLSKQGSTSTPD